MSGVMKDTRFHYQAEDSEETARATVAKLTAAGPCFICPYDKEHCDPYCVCSVYPYIRVNGGKCYSHGYRCNNFSFIGDK